MCRKLVKPAELVDTGLHIYSQVGTQDSKILPSKTSLVHKKNSNPGLRVNLDTVYVGKSRDALTNSGMQKNSKNITHNYSLCPRQGE